MIRLRTNVWKTWEQWQSCKQVPQAVKKPSWVNSWRNIKALRGYFYVKLLAESDSRTKDWRSDTENTWWMNIKAGTYSKNEAITQRDEALVWCKHINILETSRHLLQRASVNKL